MKSNKIKLNIRRIARECNFSPAAVSNVINNKGRLKQETRKKILETIKRLKYDPYQNMPWITKRLTRLIGLVVPFTNFESDPFFSQAMTRAKTAVSEEGYNCIVYFDREMTRMIALDSPQGRHTIPCDGFIFFCPNPDWEPGLRVLNSWDIPCALIRRKTTVPGVTVLSDNDSQGTWLAMDHLHQLGHTRIGMISVDHGAQNYLEERRHGYDEYIRQHGLEHNVDWIFVFHENRKTPLLGDWLKALMTAPSRPTAFFCWDDTLAISLIKNATALGWRVPEELAVVGYDNAYIGESFQPALTTVNIPVKEMIETACHVIFDRIAGNTQEKSIIEFKNELIVRESSGVHLKVRNTV